MLAEFLQVGRIDDLHMLYSPAPVVLIGFGQFLDRADNLGICSITDSVDCGLKPIHRRPHHQIADFCAG